MQTNPKSMPNPSNKKPLSDEEFDVLLQKIIAQQVTIQSVHRNERNTNRRAYRRSGYASDVPAMHKDRRSHSYKSRENTAVYYIRVIPIAHSRGSVVALSLQQYIRCLHVYNAVIQRPPQKPEPISGGSSSEENKEGGNKE